MPRQIISSSQKCIAIRDGIHSSFPTGLQSPWLSRSRTTTSTSHQVQTRLLATSGAGYQSISCLSDTIIPPSSTSYSFNSYYKSFCYGVNMDDWQVTNPPYGGLLYDVHLAVSLSGYSSSFEYTVIPVFLSSATTSGSFPASLSNGNVLMQATHLVWDVAGGTYNTKYYSLTTPVLTQFDFYSNDWFNNDVAIGIILISHSTPSGNAPYLTWTLSARRYTEGTSVYKNDNF